MRASSQVEDWPGPSRRSRAAVGADPVRRERFTRYIQTAVTPRQGARLLRMSLTSDISEALPLVQAPTLVIYPRDLRLIPARGRAEFTDLIPGAASARFPATQPHLRARRGARRRHHRGVRHRRRARPATSRVLATVLFTDLVDSTRRAAHSGDRGLGDGARAATSPTPARPSRPRRPDHQDDRRRRAGPFTGPAQGVRCARQIISDARELGLDVRTGLHTGEVERTSEDVAGLAVHLAARIMSLAGPRSSSPAPSATSSSAANSLHRPRRTRAQGHPGPLVRLRARVTSTWHLLPRAGRADRFRVRPLATVTRRDVGPAASAR